MTNLAFYKKELKTNKSVFNSLFNSLEEESYTWKPNAEKWSALEILCHLIDEEKEDFRFRMNFIIENQKPPLPSIDPVNWAVQRNYASQNFKEKFKAFFLERDQSLEYLDSLDCQADYWNNTCEHQHFGLLTPEFFLNNWLAHDLLHIKQLTRLKYDYLTYKSKQRIDYAGQWT